MVKTSEKLVKQMNEVVDLAMKSVVTFDAIASMDDNALQSFRLLNDIMKSSGELMIKQAETIEKMSEKLDKMEYKLNELSKK